MKNSNEPMGELERLCMKQDKRKQYEWGESATRTFIQTSDYRDREFYSITLSPLESKVHSLGIWYNFDARERLVSSLWSEVKHYLNRTLHNNYRRYPEKQIKDFVAIEHYDKNDAEKLIKPHLHGTITIDKSLQQKFQETFHKNGDEFRLNLACFDKKHAIYSVFLEHITSRYDLNRWNGYALKQQFGENLE